MIPNRREQMQLRQKGSPQESTVILSSYSGEPGLENEADHRSEVKSSRVRIEGQITGTNVASSTHENDPQMTSESDINLEISIMEKALLVVVSQTLFVWEVIVWLARRTDDPVELMGLLYENEVLNPCAYTVRLYFGNEY